MRTLRTRCLGWFAAGSALLVLAGLVQVPQIWISWLA